MYSQLMATPSLHLLRSKILASSLNPLQHSSFTLDLSAVLSKYVWNDSTTSHHFHCHPPDPSTVILPKNPWSLFSTEQPEWFCENIRETMAFFYPVASYLTVCQSKCSYSDLWDLARPDLVSYHTPSLPMLQPHWPSCFSSNMLLGRPVSWASHGLLHVSSLLPSDIHWITSFT